MEYARVGKSGLTVSRICMGSDYFGSPLSEADASALLRAAFDRGITFWDTSNAYNNGAAESFIGKELSKPGIRDQIVLQTKVFYPTSVGAPNNKGAGRRHILQEIEAQLKRLQTDWIDIYYLHRADFETPIEETIETLNTCVKDGKIRYWGTSTFPAWLQAEAWWRCDRRGWVPSIGEQAPYNLLDRRIENERIPFLKEYGQGLITWSSIVGGLLSGKYRPDSMENPPAGTRLEEKQQRWQRRVGKPGLTKAYELTELARNAGIDPIHFSVAWLLRQAPVASAVIGARNIEQLDSYLGALSVTLDDAILEQVDQIVPPGTAVADFHDTSGWFIGSLPETVL